MNRVLLTSVFRPIKDAAQREVSGAELFHSLITRAQGPFSLRQVIRCWSLDYLAENIEAPAVVLHYPTAHEFEEELQRLQPTHVGINFVVSTFGDIPEMSLMIRKHAPNAKIVLGGYGTVLPDEILKPHADLICRDEGIAFLRRELGEKMDRPIVAPHAPISGPRLLSLQPKAVVGHVTAGLGCPHGCDFCSTSHYFDRRYIPFMKTGREIYDALLATRARAQRDGVEMSSFILVDEDFFLQQRRAREFLDCVREGGEPLSLMGFGSVRGLSEYEPREIAEMGFELLWNGFEAAKAGYPKLKGKKTVDELYRGLTSVGCGVIASMIIGFPYQDAATVRAEVDQLLALEPALFQCLIRFAFPGTPLHDEVVKLAAYRKDFQNRMDLRTYDGFSAHFEHPGFKDRQELEGLQEEAYRQDFERLGPSIMRLARAWLTGFTNLRSDSSPLLRKRAELLKGRARGVLPVLKTIMRHGPSQAVRDRAEALRRDLIDQTGAMTAAERATEAGGPALFRLTEQLMEKGVLQQPGLLRVTHRMPDSAETQHTANAFNLQGGFASGRRLLDALGEEVARRVMPQHDLPPVFSLDLLNRNADVPRSDK